MNSIYIVSSFSGGKTSAEMTKRLLERYKTFPVKVFGRAGKPEYTYHVGKRSNGKAVKIIVVMANTGRERIETLKFSNDCDKNFGFHINYVEAVVHNERKGSTHKKVKFKNLDIKGSPYREVIKKYGIPNMVYLHCTRELKANPIKSFLKSIGWSNYLTAIGYRIDEPKRFKNKKPGQIYPLVYAYPLTKLEVNDIWNHRSFTLNLEEHQGNCDLCFKKYTPKLLLHIHELYQMGREDIIEWWREQEKQFQNYTPETRSECNPPYRFFRGNKSIDELIRESKIFFSEATEIVNKEILLRQSNGSEKNDCEESCEAF